MYPAKSAEVIEKELSMVMNDWNVTFFPRMSKQLTAIARSGRHLFAQYHMIEAAYQRGSSSQQVTCHDHAHAVIDRAVGSPACHRDARRLGD